MRFISVLILALVAGPLVAAVRLSTIAEINAFPESEYAKGIPFRITGQIVAASDNKTVVLADGPNRLSFWLDWKGLCKSGDFVIVTGRTAINPYGDRYLTISQVYVTGHGSAPEPIDATIEQIHRNAINRTLVRVSGTVTDAFQDEIDPGYLHLILTDGGRSIILHLMTRDGAPPELQKFVNAMVRTVGICFQRQSGWRKFSLPNVSIDKLSDIEILTPAPADPFDVESLTDAGRSPAEVLVGGGRRRANGRVVAVWNRDRFLVRSANGRIVQAIVAHDQPLPPTGEYVRVVGQPQTDLFHANLISAVWRTEESEPVELPEPLAVSVRDLLTDKHGNRRFHMPWHGQAIRVTGLVRSLPARNGIDTKALLDCDGLIVPVETSGCPEALDALAVGSVVTISGVCLMEADDWHPDQPFPRVKGFTVILRTPRDVVIDARPPWWTPRRLLAVIAALLVGLLGVGIRTRVQRRIDELRIGERTRLAVELHDTLSQNLAGVACQVASSRNAISENDELARDRLRTAERMLKSCRTELRQCLFDLRNDALEEPDFAAALRKTLEQVETDANVRVECDIRRSRLHDAAAHALLCIARELVANAVRHGSAQNVVIGGRTDGDAVTMTVTDDGCGFDPERCAGLAEGHFGLSGIGDRVKHLNGDFRIHSTRNGGTTATVTIPTAKE